MDHNSSINSITVTITRDYLELRQKKRALCLCELAHDNALCLFKVSRLDVHV